MRGKAGGPSTGRGAARTALAIVVGGLCLFVLFGTGPMGAFAQVAPIQTTTSGSPSESPSEEPSEQPSPTATVPAGPTVVLLNPAAEHEPPFGVVDPAPETPKISDKNDGQDTTYHVVAVTKQAPSGATVQAFWQSSGQGEVSIGTMNRLSDSRDTWETHWDVPDELDGTDGTLTVKLFNGTQELSSDSEEAMIDNNEEAVEIVWPTDGGQLGWYKPRGGKWRTVLEGTASRFTNRVYLMYSVSKPGHELEYKNCGATTFVAPAAPPAGVEFRTGTFNCELAGKDLPSQVTSIAATASETDNPLQPGTGLTAALTGESSDAHRVRGFAQEPSKMSLTITPVQPTATSNAYPTADAQQAGNDCLEFDVSVFDQFDRPVLGANVDVHLRGPSDEVGFGLEGSTSTGSSDFKAPDQGDGHEKETAWDCDSPGDRTDIQQGEHEDPKRDDNKHAESVGGSGLSGPSGLRPGQWRFHVFSPDAGRTRITAWVDDKPLRKETDNREADNDKPGDTEPSTTSEAQWLAGPVQVRLVPQSDSFITNTCSPVTVSVRGGNTPVEGANVDVHATGPTDNLDFCEPTDGSDVRAPDLGEHDEEDEQESTHPSEDPDVPSTQHTEGETDDAGSFTVGLQSPDDGDTTLQAWVDGTRGQDNDVRATAEPTGTGTYTWASSADDATVRFLNPSGYGGGSGDNVSTNPDANNFFHIITRVDLPDLVQGVEILISSDGTSFSKLGDAARVGQSEVFQFQWTATNFEEGGYTLRARITGTERFDDREIDLDNGLQSAEITAPALNATASFVEQKTTVAGVASDAAEGVTFYYTTTAARDRNDEDQWVECGSVELPTADGPQNFEGECELAEGDQGGSVTGIAAIAYICEILVGCDEDLSPPIHESGDAHRVFGLDAVPTVGIAAGSGEAAAGICQRVVIDVEDQGGGAVPNAPVDVHLDGPQGAHFCGVDGDSPRDAPNEGNHSAVSGHPDEGKHRDSNAVHTEGETGNNGRFVVGITSPREGRSRLTAWVDQTENDEEDGGESSADARFDWVQAGKCTESGTSGDDVIHGTPGNDRLCGLGGDDVIDGRGGRDVLLGAGGRDILRGDSGNDSLVGGGGTDSMVGGPGDDSIKGGKANDVLSGRGGRDTLRGGSDNDSLNGGNGRDSCFGDRGSDQFKGCERRQQ